ncbi:MAG: hypothetical protein IPM79_32375 [Polyangiaceae bacterium]|nr:hypothetical protein [Polyangiaceae bacterium]
MRRTPAPSFAPLFAALSLFSCRPEGAPAEPVSPGVSSTASVATGGPPGAGAPLCGPALPGESPRAKGLLALSSGKVTEAARHFEAAVREAPGDVASQVLLIASKKEQERRSLALEDALNQEKPTVLDINAKPTAPPSQPGDAAKVRLKIASESKNLVVDDADWFKDNGLRKVVSRPAQADVPEHLPRRHLGAPLTLLFDHGDHQIGVYNASIVVASPTSEPRTFSFSPQLAWTEAAQVVGDSLLVVAQYHQSHNQRSRLYSFELTSGKLRWASENDVMNAQTFAVTKDHVATGFGGTGVPDHVFWIDRATGSTLQKVALKSAPDHVQLKEGRLFVRTYDTNVVLDASSPMAAAPPATLPPRAESARAAWPDSARCAVERAIAATEARDQPKLAAAVEALQAEKIEASFAGAFDGALRFFEQQKARGGLDLATVKPVKMPAPPWDATVLEPAGPAPASTPKLVKLSTSKGGQPLVMRRGKYDPARPWIIPPVEKGKVPFGARGDIPSQYGLEDLRVIIPSGDRLLLVYGGRYLAVTRGDETEAIFDLETYRHPPKVSDQWKEFAVSDVTYAQVADGVVYVANGGGSYAKEMFGKKAFVSAISLSTKKLLWRSKPLVHGAGPFALTKDFLVTGYGFTDEPDNLFVLRRDTGAVAASMPLESAPDEVSINGDRVTVQAYAHSYEIELKR